MTYCASVAILAMGAPVTLTATTVNSLLVYRPPAGAPPTITISASAPGTTIQIGDAADCAAARAGYGPATASVLQAPWTAAGITVTSSYASLVLCNGIVTGAVAVSKAPQSRSSLEVRWMQLADKGGLTVIGIVRGGVNVTSSVLAGPVALRAVEQGSTVVLRNVTVAPTDVATMAKDAFTVDGVLDDSTVLLSFLTAAPYYTPAARTDSFVVVVSVLGTAVRTPPLLVSITDCVISSPYLQTLPPAPPDGSNLIAFNIAMNGPALAPLSLVVLRNTVQLFVAIQRGTQVTAVGFSVTTGTGMPPRGVTFSQNRIALTAYWPGTVGIDSGGNIMGVYVLGVVDGGGPWHFDFNDVVCYFDTTSVNRFSVPARSLYMGSVRVAAAAGSSVGLGFTNNRFTVASPSLPQEGGTLVALDIANVVFESGDILFAGNVMRMSTDSSGCTPVSVAGLERAGNLSSIRIVNNTGDVSLADRNSEITWFPTMFLLVYDHTASDGVTISPALLVTDNVFPGSLVAAYFAVPRAASSVTILRNRCGCICFSAIAGTASGTVSDIYIYNGLMSIVASDNAVMDSLYQNCSRSVIFMNGYGAPDLTLLQVTNNAIVDTSPSARNTAVMVKFDLETEVRRPGATVLITGNLMEATAAAYVGFIMSIPFGELGNITIANNTFVCQQPRGAYGISAVFFATSRVTVHETLVLYGNRMIVTGYFDTASFILFTAVDVRNFSFVNNTVISDTVVVTCLSMLLPPLSWPRLHYVGIIRNTLSSPTCEFTSLVVIQMTDASLFFPRASDATIEIVANALTTWAADYCTHTAVQLTGMISVNVPGWENSTLSIRDNVLTEVDPCAGMNAILVDMQYTAGVLPALVITNNFFGMKGLSSYLPPRAAMTVSCGIGEHSSDYSVVVSDNGVVVGTTTGYANNAIRFSTTSSQRTVAVVPPLLCAECEARPVLFHGNVISIRGGRFVSAIYISDVSRLVGPRSGFVPIHIVNVTMSVEATGSLVTQAQAIVFDVADLSISHVRIVNNRCLMDGGVRETVAFVASLPPTVSLELTRNMVELRTVSRTGYVALIVVGGVNTSFPTAAAVANNSLNVAATNIALILVMSSSSSPSEFPLARLGVLSSGMTFLDNRVVASTIDKEPFRVLIVFFGAPVLQQVAITFENNTFRATFAARAAVPAVLVQGAQLLPLRSAAGVTVVARCNRDSGVLMRKTAVPETSDFMNNVVRVKVIRCNPTESITLSGGSPSRTGTPSPSRTATNTRRTRTQSGPTMSPSQDATRSLTRSGTRASKSSSTSRGSWSTSGSKPSLSRRSVSLSMSRRTMTRSRGTASATATLHRYLPRCNVTGFNMSIALRPRGETADWHRPLTAAEINDPGVVVIVTALGWVQGQDERTRGGREVPFSANAGLATSVAACSASGLQLPDWRVESDGLAVRFASLAAAGGGMSVGVNGALHIPLGPTRSRDGTAALSQRREAFVVVSVPQFVRLTFPASAFDCDARAWLDDHQGTGAALFTSVVLEVRPSPFGPVVTAQTASATAAAIAVVGSVTSASTGGGLASVQALAALAQVRCGSPTTQATAQPLEYTMSPFALGGPGSLTDDERGIAGQLAAVVVFAVVQAALALLSRFAVLPFVLPLLPITIMKPDPRPGEAFNKWRAAFAAVRFPGLLLRVSTLAMPGTALLAVRTLFAVGPSSWLAIFGLAFSVGVPAGQAILARHTAGAVTFVEGENLDALRFYRFIGASRWIVKRCGGVWRRLARAGLPVGCWGPRRARMRAGEACLEYRQVYAVSLACAQSLQLLLFVAASAVPTGGGWMCGMQFALLGLTQLGPAITLFFVQPYRVEMRAWLGLASAVSTTVGIVAAAHLALSRVQSEATIQVLTAATSAVALIELVGEINAGIIVYVESRWEGDGDSVPYYEGARSPSFSWTGRHMDIGESWVLSEELLDIATGIERHGVRGDGPASNPAPPHTNNTSSVRRSIVPRGSHDLADGMQAKNVLRAADERGGRAADERGGRAADDERGGRAADDERGGRAADVFASRISVAFPSPLKKSIGNRQYQTSSNHRAITAAELDDL